VSRPTTEEYATYYGRYIDLVQEEDIQPLLAQEIERTRLFLRGISEEDAGILHPPYTWTARQVVGHLCDAERVFGYRALRFARGDTTELAGFEENGYVAAGDFDRRTLADLVEEFSAVRAGHVRMFAGLPSEAWDRRAIASGAVMSVRALAYGIVGHERHHIGILRRRYGAAR
jgi:hypothetical protein